VGDVIMRVNGERVADVESFYRRLWAQPGSQTLDLSGWRNGAIASVSARPSVELWGGRGPSRRPPPARWSFRCPSPHRAPDRARSRRQPEALDREPETAAVPRAGDALLRNPPRLGAGRAPEAA